MIYTNKLDGFFAIPIARATRAVCRLTGWSNFQCARLAVNLGTAIITVTLVYTVAFSPSADLRVVAAAVSVPIYVWYQRVVLRLIGRIEATTQSADLLPLSTMLDILCLCNSRWVFMALGIGTVAIELIAAEISLWSIGVIIEASGLYAATAFEPPGSSAWARTKERIRTWAVTFRPVPIGT